MEENKVWDIVDLLECAKRVGCKWTFKTTLRLNVTLKEMLNDIKLDLLLKDLLKKMALIIKRHFHLSQRKTHYELFWHWWLILT